MKKNDSDRLNKYSVLVLCIITLILLMSTDFFDYSEKANNYIIPKSISKATFHDNNKTAIIVFNLTDVKQALIFNDLVKICREYNISGCNSDYLIKMESKT